MSPRFPPPPPPPRLPPIRSSTSQASPLQQGPNPTLFPFGAVADNSMPNTSHRWQRVLLKVSGEALAGDHKENIDPKITMAIAREVASVTRLGIEAAICWTCGATGYEELLIYCSKCRISAEHLYCERKIPENWKCELCKARDPKTLSPFQLGFYRYRNRKNVKHRVKKTNCVLEKVLLQKSRIDNIGRAAVKKIDRSYGTSERTHHLSIVDTSKIRSRFKIVDVSNTDGFSSKIKKDKNFKRPRGRVVLAEDEINEDDAPGPIAKLAFKKIDGSYGASEPTHHFSVADTSKIGRPVKILDASNIEGFSSKVKKDKNFKRPRKSLVLTEEDEINEDDVTGPIGKSSFKKIDRLSRRVVLSEEDEINKNDVSEPTHHFGNVDTSKIGSPVKFVDVSSIEIEKGKNFKRPRRLVLAEEDEIDEDVSGPIGNSGFDKLVSQTGKTLSTQDTSIKTQDTSINEAYVPAMPIIHHLWRGCFEISNVVYGPLSAHPSNVACKKVWDSAIMLPQLLHAEKLSRLDVWPKSFEVSPPNEHNIGLYFFPHCERAESMHDQFLYDLINEGIALKVTMDTAELIIFASSLLPEGFRRFQGKFYLWGVFRGRNVPVQFQGCAEKEQKESSSPNVQNSEDGSLSHYLGKLKKHVPLPRMLDRCLSKLGQLDEDKHHEEKDLIPQTEEIEDGEICEEATLVDHKDNDENVDYCLNLFPLHGESIAITTRSTSGNGVSLELEIGRSGSNRAWQLNRGSESPLVLE